MQECGDNAKARDRFLYQAESPIISDNSLTAAIRRAVDSGRALFGFVKVRRYQLTVSGAVALRPCCSAEHRKLKLLGRWGSEAYLDNGNLTAKRCPWIISLLVGLPCCLSPASFRFLTGVDIL